MNHFSDTRSTEANIRYLDGDFDIITHGAFVTCAVSGVKIPLDELKYWSVARQEPYADGQISFAKELEANPDLRKRSKA